jgi:hypothetical protein
MNKKKRMGRRNNNGEDEPNWGTIHVYMEMSQQNPLYNYHILIKTFKKESRQEAPHMEDVHRLYAHGIPFNVSVFM